MIEAFHYVLVAVTIATAMATIGVRDLTRAIALFAAFNVSVSMIYYLLGAPFVAVFQLLVYAGAVTVLFLVTLHTLGGGLE
ncbi:MAG: NADH-quinone oxidoreductase subunit J [Candidatus Bathyarchaeia archaeon]